VKPAATLFETPFGAFELGRYPRRAPEPLQAWNAADLLLLEAARDNGAPANQILVGNDHQGALCTALSPMALWTDSANSALALRANQHANGRAATPVIYSTQPPPQFSLALLQIPKHAAFFEYQLAQLAGKMTPGSILYAAGMDKHLSPKAAALLEHYIGPTQRHRGRQKARLFSAVKSEHAAPAGPSAFVYFSEALDAELTALPNVFSGDRLDRGTRLLLSALSALPNVDKLIDLGCGNGILGLASLHRRLASTVVFADESALAIASAKLNSARLFPALASKIAFHHDDGLQAWTDEPAQLIVCNPPFHLDTHVDEFAGRHLLAQCVQKLTPGGQLCLVANRHLHYHALLKRHFGNCEQIAQDSKFNVYLCTNNAA
jgi:23S rRNA (guanine1835-N2)-methyltransferase